MPLTQSDRDVVTEFRAWFDAALRGDGRFGSAQREDRADDSTLASRWAAAVNPRVQFEVAVRPFLPQLRVGILTDDRWKSEDLEEKIQESGDTMSEFVGLAFEELGLAWAEPPVEHYRDQGKYFYFATPLELRSLAELADDKVRIRARQMLDGYFAAFERFLPA
ncbi:MAG: hypothetical protein U1A27_13285 [Phycisphaerae bacterium]